MTTPTTAISSLAPSNPAEVTRRVAFLAGVGRVLGSSLDYRLTLQQLAELGLGVLGDLCLVGLVDEAGEPRLVAGAHVDPAKLPLLDALSDLPLTERSHTAAVLRTGRSEVLAGISEEMLQAGLDPAARDLIRSLELGPTMVVPLTVRSRTIGVLVFSRRPGREPYASADVALAEELAGRAAAAVDNAQVFAHTSHVAHALQRALLPPRLPAIPGVELAARYQPASQDMEVGGDFYDAFTVGDRRWGLLIGDVAGKGAAAAATTAVVRYSARAAARFGTALAVPSAVNDALLETEDEDDFCTLTYAELRVDDDGVELSVLNCGHPDPVLVCSDGAVRHLDCRGSLLGQFPDVAVGSVTCRLGPGDAVVFVTDGVLEARQPRTDLDEGPVDLFDDARLLDVVAAGAGDSADQLARRIEEAAVAFSGGRPSDDLAILIVRVLRPE